MSNEIMDLVQIMNDQAVTTSLKVAEYFDKQHSHVLDTIKSILAVENSATKFFFESTYENRGKQYPQYLMNRDGFSLLVMGFTGAKALKWKIKFIEAFNAMETKLKYGSEKLPMDYLEALKQLVVKEEERLALEAAYKDEKKRADENQEAANFQKQATSKDIRYRICTAAKCLSFEGLGQNKLFSFLREELGVLFYNYDGMNEVKQEQIRLGRFYMKFNETYDYPVVYITVKGMRWVYNKLLEYGYEPLISLVEWERRCREFQDDED